MRGSARELADLARLYMTGIITATEYTNGVAAIVYGAWRGKAKS